MQLIPRQLLSTNGLSTGLQQDGGSYPPARLALAYGKVRLPPASAGASFSIVQISPRSDGGYQGKTFRPRPWSRSRNSRSGDARKHRASRPVQWEKRPHLKPTNCGAVAAVTALICTNYYLYRWRHVPYSLRLRSYTSSPIDDRARNGLDAQLRIVASRSTTIRLIVESFPSAPRPAICGHLRYRLLTAKKRVPNHDRRLDTPAGDRPLTNPRYDLVAVNQQAIHSPPACLLQRQRWP